MSQPDLEIKATHLIAGLAGMLCPIPIAGEAILSYFFYPILRDSGIVGEGPQCAVASFAVSGLTRLCFYKDYYLPATDYLLKLLT